MGVRYRKSIGLGKGVRMTVGKRGVSASAGIPGFRLTAHSSGRMTRTVGIPGTGISSVSQVGGSRSSRSSSRSQPAPTSYQLPKPGLFAGKAEKRYFDAVVAFVQGRYGDVVTNARDAVSAEPSAISANLLAALALIKNSAPDDQVAEQLEAVIGSDHSMPDALQLKYLPQGSVSMSIRVTEQIAGVVPFDPVGATLILAELYQDQGRLDEAIGLVQQLADAAPEDPVIRLSLCDLLLADSDIEGALEASSGAVNDGDVGVATLHMRGAALFAAGHSGAAIEAFTAALAKTAGRDGELLMLVRYDRALALLAAGDKRKARADLEKLLAADPSFLDVRHQLAGLA